MDKDAKLKVVEGVKKAISDGDTSDIAQPYIKLLKEVDSFIGEVYGDGFEAAVSSLDALKIRTGSEEVDEYFRGGIDMARRSLHRSLENIRAAQKDFSG